jgi:two-component system sensor histidine kinase KdpD
MNYFYALGIISLCSIACFILHPYFVESNLIMVYLLGVTVVALRGQVGPSIVASVLSVLSYDFFILPPVFSFSVQDVQYVFTLIVMLVVAHIISHLTIHVRRQAEMRRQSQVDAENEHFRNILLASISHDLRTPLTAIMGSASSLLQPNVNLSEDIKHELIKNIYDESDRLNHLVNNILKMIRLEGGMVQLSKQLHALDDIIGSALNQLELSLANRIVTVNVPKPTPLIALDEVLITQVFINLIENALKFTPTDSPIEMTVCFLAQEVIVSIADHGPGIPADEIDKIFDKFYRGQTQDSKGMGLGLAICKGIIQAHHGNIAAESRAEGGTQIRFTLPRQEKTC